MQALMGNDIMRRHTRSHPTANGAGTDAAEHAAAVSLGTAGSILTLFAISEPVTRHRPLFRHTLNIRLAGV